MGGVVETLRACAGKSTSSVGPLLAHHHRNAPDDVLTVAFHATQDPIAGRTSPCLGTEAGCIGVVSDTLRSQGRSPDHGMIVGEMRPRRLTPREWERLQGFADDYTLIPGASDSARYEVLGNSMAVPVMRWIGRRLLMVDAITRSKP